MSLQFVFGPAGSGKSTYVRDMVIKEAIKNPKSSYLFIVPDQFTMQTQMDMVKQHPNMGILNIDVLSFSRLSYRVFSETGKLDVPVLDDTGKSLVLRRVASLVAKDMPYIGANLNKIGYIHEVKSSISEFMQYGLSVKDVEKLSESVENSLLKTKLKDMHVIYDAFMKFNRDRFVTGEETLSILGERLKSASFIKGATVVFDGFTGFTPVQEKVIIELCKLCEKVIITFTLSSPEKPSDVGGEEKLFYLSRRSALRLKTKAQDEGVSSLKDIVLLGTKRFEKNATLNHLEENLFRFPVKEYKDKSDNIEIISADTIESEVSAVALKIHELVRTKGYAYKDVAVVCGNLETYANAFEIRMRELDMPVFIDRTRGVSLNPFTEYLKSALLILVRDYSYDSVFHYLKSGFTGFLRDETDRFDRYIRSLNIKGKTAYHKEFLKTERGLKDKELAKNELKIHEEFRQRLVGELSVLERSGKTAGDYAKNLYEFLKNNNSYEKLKEFEAFFEAENNLSKAMEYRRIYQSIMELLDTIVSLIGEEEMSLEEFYRIFEAGISEIEVGTIPKNVDRILIGDIERTRLSEVKAVFFTGVNDGNIPKATEKGGILSQSEREAILSSGYDLAPTPREEMYTQKLYLYMNMCKPTDSLFLSYSNANAEGSGEKPSYLIDTVKRMFPGTVVLSVTEDADISKIVTAKDSLKFYSKLLRKFAEDTITEDEKKLAVALRAVYKDAGTDFTDDISDAAFTEYIAVPLSKEIARLLYGSTLRASISRMEMYAGCAYAHFLKYGMGLKRDADYEFMASDLGTIYHGVLENFASELERKNLSWSEFTKEEGNQMVAKAVRDYCENYEQGLLLGDEQSAYTVNKIIKIMGRTVDTLKFHLSRGKFMPVSHEYSFEREIKIDDDRKMLLNGKIDRIDVYEDNDRIYVKILDYKSSAHDIDVTDVYHGIKQQLMVYMSEALYKERETNPGKKIVPSAMIYYTIDNPYVSSKTELSDEELESRIRKQLKVEGMIENSSDNIALLDENAMGEGGVLPISVKKDGDFTDSSLKRVATGEEIENALGYVNQLIKTIGSNITDGDKKISPYVSEKTDACRFCDYRQVCRFDERIQGFKKRDGKEITDEEAREKVMGGDENGVYLFN